MIAALNYILCAITAFLCAVLLFRGFFKSKTNMLFWSGICFLFLFLENMILFIDIVMVPDIKLTLLRLTPGVLAILTLLYGLIWESD